MAATKTDLQLFAIIKTIISTDRIDDYEKTEYRRLARDAMEIYNRARAFNWILVFNIILSSSIFITAIVFACMGYFSNDWVVALTFGTINIIVFSILKIVFNSRFRARVTNLSNDFNLRIHNPKAEKCPVTPMVCVIGPYKNNYRGGFVNVRCQGHNGPIPPYSNLALTFFENRKGGRYTIQFKSKTGVFELKPNECAIVIASLSGSMIVVSKHTINMPPSAFEEAPKPVPQQSAPIAQEPSKPEEDLTPLGLITTRKFDSFGSFFSIPKNHVGFFVLKGNVYDMLKAGDYPLNIDDYPRLKSADPYAFKRIEPGDCPDIIMMDTESEFEIAWKFDDVIHAKGTADFKIANPRLFLNFVFEEDLLLDAKFDAFVQDTLKPLIIKKLKATKADDIVFAESELLKSLDGALDRMGLHIEHIGLSSFWKEEDDTPSEAVEHCVHCGKELPEGSMFCPYCGQKQDSGVCPNCGAKLPAGAKFCAQCGTKVDCI